MTAADVLEVVELLREAGIDACLDGGWGVDALVARQTREHGDADVAVDRSRLADAAAALASVGYAHDPAARPGLPARYVLRDERGRQVDLHPLAFDESGNGWQRLSDGDAWGLYPAADRATGTIAGTEVACISAELQHRFHLGWEWDEKARHDMQLLHDLFGTPLPPTYARRER